MYCGIVIYTIYIWMAPQWVSRSFYHSYQVSCSCSSTFSIAPVLLEISSVLQTSRGNGFSLLWVCKSTLILSTCLYLSPLCLFIKPYIINYFLTGHWMTYKHTKNFSHGCINVIIYVIIYVLYIIHICITYVV